MAFSLGEYQDIFLEEADEQLQELNQNLLELEKNPDNIDIINNIFRAAHSLKSSAAFVGLNDLSDLAHKMENLLQGIRDRTMAVTPEIVDVIFKCFDEINSVIESVAAGEEPTQDLSWIIERIKAVSEKSGSGAAQKQQTEAPAEEDSSADIPKTVIGQSEIQAIKLGLAEGKSCSEITVFIDKTAQMKWVKAQLVLSNLARIGTIVSTIPTAQNLTGDEMSNIFKVIILSLKPVQDIKNACDIDLIYRIDIKNISFTKKDNKSVLKFSGGETFLVGEELKPAEAAPPKKEQKAEAPAFSPSYAEPDEESDDDDEREHETAHAGRAAEHDKRKVPPLRTVKVSVDKLDQLLNNVGELVIANSGFYKLYEEIRKLGDDKSITNEFKNRMEQMSRIAKDLQTGIMKTRMVPIGQVFSRFNRLVRDLTKEFGKNIELLIKGEDTELDKKVIDAIGEPLMHLIRNAVDHGIEPLEDRKKLGKSDIATVSLNAYQGGNQIFVEVSDDGKGLNSDIIKRKAIEKGFITPEMLANMDTTDINNLIFIPGFSTATKITDVSGRGVGMNVVKEIVNELNGNVTIETEPGMGTRFVLAFPLTLAIIPAIMVKVRNEMYAIPLSDVIETIKIAESDITTIEGHEVINLRGEILSLLRLNEFVGVPSALFKEQKMPVVVVGFGNRKIGLIVDFLEGKQEIVIKSLEQNYMTVDGLAGASILGDGSICLILDISSMINKVISDQDKLKHFDKDSVSVQKASVETITPEEMQTEQPAKPKPSSLAEKPSVPGSITILTDDTAKTPAAPEPPPSKPHPAYEKEKERAIEFEAGSMTATKEESLYQKTAQPAPEKPAAPEPSIKKESAAGATPASSAPPKDKAAPAAEKPAAAPVDEFTPVEEEFPAGTKSEDEIKQQVRDTLSDFRQELKDRTDIIKTGSPVDHMREALDLSKEDINEFQVIANVGATNSAESLSKILGKRIDLSIPEVTVKPIEGIPDFLGDINSVYIGVMLPILGDARGTLLFILKEDVGFSLIDMLYGTGTRQTREMDEDGESALKEITNIIGSSVINVFAEKSGLVIKPSVPTIVHDYMQSVIDSILVMHNMTNDYAIIMDTAFYFEDDNIIGNLLLLPEAESLKILVSRLRAHG
ncbi:MAG TPA: chemotaxis protein CheW [Spirochaetota bacterium]|nr:chemotaxis protein CheW [Spirochaetota bacterium]